LADYVAEIAGSTLGVHNDDYVTFPENVTNLVDLLEAKNLSWKVCL
jgi:acid phosphatase